MTPKYLKTLEFDKIVARAAAFCTCSDAREKLLSEIWGYDFFGDDRTLDTHIKLLRRQLGPYADRITTLRGVGYRFEQE